MKKHAERAFTLVELIIVVVVVSILFAIVASVYSGIQAQARDAKNADAADKVADAISLFMTKYGRYPAGGSGSSVAIGSGTECTNGLNGWFSYYYTCDIEDTLVASGYLPSDFAFNLSPNKTYSLNNGTMALMVYRYGPSGTPASYKALVMYSMENPSSADTANFNNEITKCVGNLPVSFSPRDTNGMRNGTCVILPVL